MTARSGEKPPRDSDRAVGHLFTFAVAALTWWGLKSYVLQAYPVKTPSMEPTIEGDRNEGDLVLVDKTFDNRARPDRFDTIVFGQNGGAKVFVKRVAGLPGEYIRIRGFDIWIGTTPETLERVVKSPVEHRDLILDYWSADLDDAGLATKRWRRESTRIDDDSLILDGEARSTDTLFPKSRFRNVGMSRRRQTWLREWQLNWNDGSIMIGYVDAFGDRQASLPACIDFGVRSEIRADADTSVWIDMRYGDASWALRYESGGSAELWRNGAILDGTSPVRVPPLTDGATVQFMYLDGGFVLVVDGQVRFRRDVSFADLRIEPKRYKAWNGLGIAAAGGKATLRGLTIVQDLHYLEQGSFSIHEPHPIPEDAIFVLGDNSRDSRDSRHQGSVALRDVIGRPVAVVAPASRRRFLIR